MYLERLFPTVLNVSQFEEFGVKPLDKSTYYFIDKENYRAIYEPSFSKSEKEKDFYYQRRILKLI